jgi:hypothetical protein
VSGLGVETGSDRSVHSGSEVASYLTIGVAFALGGVWVMVNRPTHWSWVVCMFLLALIPESAIALARLRMGRWRSTALGLGLSVLMVVAFWLSGWPVGSGALSSFFFGFGAGNFLASALRAYVRRDAPIQGLTP